MNRFCLCLVLAAVVLCVPGLALTVTVTGGMVRGAVKSDGSVEFRGIPYAAPPLEDLRWQPPQPVKPWKGVRSAIKAAAPCIQHNEGWNAADAAAGKEDCLYLSLHAPKIEPGTKLPVIFWIHGGSNRAGSGYGYADSAIYSHGVVLVTIEYRLGAFGFLGMPALSAESAQHASGNYALMDMVAALKWVQANIARFGGDPDNVTIAGQSAGSADVVQLMFSPLAHGLFHKVIAESGIPGPPRTAADNEKIGSDLLTLLHLPAGPEGLKALRKLPAKIVLEAGDKLHPPSGLDDSMLWGQQIVDGYVEPKSIDDVFKVHGEAPVPMIIGNNVREVPLDLPSDAVRKMISTLYGDRAPEALKLYGLDGADMPKDDPVLGSVATQLITDVAFRCPSNWVANWHRKSGWKVWRYQFSVPDPTTKGPVAHNAELKYVFDAAPAGASFASWPPVQQYWANFARSGDPNGAGLPSWPDMGNDATYIDFTPDGPQLGKDLRGAICRTYNAEN